MPRTAAKYEGYGFLANQVQCRVQQVATIAFQENREYLTRPLHLFRLKFIG